MLRKILFFPLLLFLTVQNVSAQTAIGKPVSRNDHIFPPAQRAKPFIDYDKKGFIINGKRTFIVSAGIEYARVPRGLWRDRLLKLKRGGFNAVEIYTFWNYHEPVEGQFDFSGDQDLDAFLKLVDDLNMYAIVRVGPYYCGEWTLGGFPIWLKFKPGLRVRENNSPFLTAVGKFFDKLIPIVAANQINHGGSVVMVQLENEHRAAWGTIVPDPYFKFLIEKTVSLGLQVPYFFSGLHPGNDPAGNLKNLDDPQRPNPWFSTEYWGIWFSNYGPQPQDSTIYDRRTWKIIARGGNGYNVYMAHGGSNFDYNNDRDMAASYDYGAAVGQTGDLRPIYYGFKRAAWFARSFQDILANGTDATESTDVSSASNKSLVVNARSAPAGTITFFDNPGSDPAETMINCPVTINLSASNHISLAPGEIMPVVQNYKLTNDVKLLWAPVRIYSIVPQGNTTTLLVYGATGSHMKMYFDVSSKAIITHGKQNFKMLSSGVLEFSSLISTQFHESIFEAGGRRIRVLAINNQLAQRVWLTEAGGKMNIVIGPAYVGEVKIKGNRFSITTERSWQDSSDFPVWVFKPSGAPLKLIKYSQPGGRIVQLKLAPWQVKNASEPIQPDYNDKRWKFSDDPLQMGADGDISANAWYRTTITVPETGKYTLQFQNVRERGSLFLDGKWIDNVNVNKKTAGLDLQAGKLHQITAFTAHTGRNKLIFYVGPPDTIDAKGLTGPVILKKSDGSGAVTKITKWRMRGGPGDPEGKSGWKRIPPSNTELNTPHFFKTKFSLPPLKGTLPVWRVVTTSLSYGSVWVNGHNLGRYPEKIKINGLYIPESWLKQGTNTLIIYDESGVYPDKVSIEAETAASRDKTIFIESNRLQ